MSNEKNNFNKCIDSCKELNSVFSYLTKNKVSTLNISSILRAEFVLIVSAFDFYIHQIVCRKMVELFQNGTITSDEKLISIQQMQRIFHETNSSTQQELLSVALREKFSKDSFQSSRSIDYALSLIGIDRIWSRISTSMGDAPENIKRELDLIVHRRNQIAHEADIDISTASYREINESDVNDCRSFINKLVTSIDSIIV